MKRFFTVTLSVLALSTVIAASAKAETRIDRQLLSYDSARVQPASNQALLSPFDLAFLAQRGYLKDQGISSYAALDTSYEAGTITAKDVVQAAIRANRLPESTLQDRCYLSALDSNLRGFNIH
ncbi:hypothetical protein H6F89_32525 [Cyanobacteria bacterium FACHB-63]|nr:hypothetical protein [Cyanobacteria bacterium FACHB-63]